MKRRLNFTLQNKLGVLDRVLGALTCRGFIPEEFVVTTDPETGNLHCALTMICNDDKIVEKLVKFLDKQVYVLTAQEAAFGPETPEATFAHTSTSPFIPLYVKRRKTHADSQPSIH